MSPINRAILGEAIAVDRTYPVSERAPAREYLAAGMHFGKIALSMFDH